MNDEGLPRDDACHNYERYGAATRIPIPQGIAMCVGVPVEAGCYLECTLHRVSGEEAAVVSVVVTGPRVNQAGLDVVLMPRVAQLDVCTAGRRSIPVLAPGVVLPHCRYDTRLRGLRGRAA